MKGKILSRAALNRRGMLRSDDDLCCPLCGFEEEENSHLFTVCPLAKHQWTSFSNLMGVSWVFERTCGGIIDSWVISNLGHKSKVAWNTIPMTILWYVWKRGTLEFSKTKRDTNDIFQMDKWRLGAWLLAGKEFKGYKMSDFDNSWESCMSGDPRKNRIGAIWTPPPHRGRQVRGES